MSGVLRALTGGVALILCAACAGPGEVGAPVPASATPIVAIAPVNPSAEQQACAEKLGKPVEMTNSFGMRFRLIPPGEFTMGSAGGQADEAPHRVRITKPFYMSVTEVTRAQWEAVTGKQHSSFFPGPDAPVNFVAYDMVEHFIAVLNKKEGAKYRTPTEAEWEYAARAGTATRYYTGDAPADLDRAAWHAGNAGDALHPVAQKEPNAFGLYDMLGNAWEWCSDFYDRDYYRSSPTDDPTGPKLSLYGYRVVRGGSIYFGPDFCRCAHRDYYQDSRTDKQFGFRIVLPVLTGAPAATPAAK